MDQATSVSSMRSASHRLSSQRSRSCTKIGLKSYWVSSSTPRTVQLFCRLQRTGMTGLLEVFARSTQWIWLMENESSDSNRELTPVGNATTTSS